MGMIISWISIVQSTISMRSMLMLGGSGGMSPRKILKIRCSEIEFGGYFGVLAIYSFGHVDL